MTVEDNDKENVNRQRFEAIESRLLKFEDQLLINHQAILSGNDDTKRLVEWLHGAAIGVKVIRITSSLLVTYLIWLSKVIGGVLAIFALYKLAKTGELPTFTFKMFDW